MKAVLEFNLPDEMEHFAMAFHGDKLYVALMGMQHRIRAWEKHDGDNPEGLIDLLKDDIAVALKPIEEGT